jgi:hypothetical protein
MTLVNRIDFIRGFFRGPQPLNPAGIARISAKIFGQRSDPTQTRELWTRTGGDQQLRKLFAATLRWLEHTNYPRTGSVAKVYALCLANRGLDLQSAELESFMEAVDAKLPPRANPLAAEIGALAADLGKEGSALRAEKRLGEIMETNTLGEVGEYGLAPLLRLIAGKGEGMAFPGRWGLLTKALLEMTGIEHLSPENKAPVAAAVQAKIAETIADNSFSWDFDGGLSRLLLKLGERRQVAMIREMMVEGIRKALTRNMDIVNRPENQAQKQAGDPDLVFIMLPLADGRVLFSAAPFQFEHELTHMERKYDDVWGMNWPNDKVPGNVIKITGNDVLDRMQERQTCFRGVTGRESTMGEMIILQMPMDRAGLTDQQLAQRFVEAVEILHQAGYPAKTRVVVPGVISRALGVGDIVQNITIKELLSNKHD